ADVRQEGTTDRCVDRRRRYVPAAGRPRQPGSLRYGQGVGRRKDRGIGQEVQQGGSAVDRGQRSQGTVVSSQSRSKITMRLPLRPCRRPIYYTVLVALALLWGCAGQGPPVEPTGNQFDAIQRDIFDVHCLSAGCHNAQEQAGGMNLSQGSAWPNLVN